MHNIYNAIKNIFQSNDFHIYIIVRIIPEGTRDALCYKVQKARVLTISQNCSALCINEGGRRETHSQMIGMKHHAF